MSSIDTEIWLSLRQYIDSIDLATPQWPVWPIAYPGSDYEPKSGKPFLAVGEMVAEPIRRVINRNIQDRTGSIMISAVMPIGQDPAVYKDIGAHIADQFQGVINCDTPTRIFLMSSTGGKAFAAAGYRDGGWWRVVVNVPWRTWQ